MRSVKLHVDTLQALQAIKTRKGGSYDSAIHYLLARDASSVEPILAAAAQWDRIEMALLEIRDLLKKPASVDSKASGTFVVS